MMPEPSYLGVPGFMFVRHEQHTSYLARELTLARLDLGV
jgi:hypothetical protein